QRQRHLRQPDARLPRPETAAQRQRRDPDRHRPVEVEGLGFRRGGRGTPGESVPSTEYRVRSTEGRVPGGRGSIWLFSTPCSALVTRYRVLGTRYFLLPCGCRPRPAPSRPRTELTRPRGHILIFVARASFPSAGRQTRIAPWLRFA